MYKLLQCFLKRNFFILSFFKQRIAVSLQVRGGVYI